MYFRVAIFIFGAYDIIQRKNMSAFLKSTKYMSADGYNTSAEGFHGKTCAVLQNCMLAHLYQLRTFHQACPSCVSYSMGYACYTTHSSTAVHGVACEELTSTNDKSTYMAILQGMLKIHSARP